MKWELLQWIQEWLEHEMLKPYLKLQLDGGPRYIVILLGLKAANLTFQTLFSALAWLDGAQACLVGEQGLSILYTPNFTCFFTGTFRERCPVD